MRNHEKVDSSTLPFAASMVPAASSSSQEGTETPIYTPSTTSTTLAEEASEGQGFSASFSPYSPDHAVGDEARPHNENTARNYSEDGEGRSSTSSHIFIPLPSFPEPLDIPGLELPPLSPESPPPSNPSPTVESDRPSTDSKIGLADETGPTEEPSRESTQDISLDDTSDGKGEEEWEYMVIPKKREDQGRTAAAFIRMLELVPITKVHPEVLGDQVLYWGVVLSESKANLLLADPDIGAVCGGPNQEYYDPTC